MTDAERAWIVREHLAGLTQSTLARHYDVSNTVICSAIKRFCDDWSGHDVRALLAYNEERRKYALLALQNYFFHTDGAIEQPETLAQPPWATAYDHARMEHIWLLRAEKLKLHEIGARIGISKERVRQTIWKFGRRVARAMRHTRWYTP